MANATDVTSVDSSENELAEWAGHPLAQYLAAGWRNTVRTFSSEAKRYGALAEVDALLRTLVGDPVVNEDPLASGFLVRTHAEWLSAVSLGLSGQVSQAYIMMGSCLETATRGLYVASDAELRSVWSARHDDQTSDERAQESLKGEAALANLQKLDGDTAGVVAKLLTRARDRSSHPNTYVNLSRGAGGSVADCQREYYTCDNEVQRACLRSITQAGIGVLTVFYFAFGDRYRELELGDRINELRQGH